VTVWAKDEKRDEATIRVSKTTDLNQNTLSMGRGFWQNYSIPHAVNWISGSLSINNIDKK
jgi:hypothetical protein